MLLLFRFVSDSLWPRELQHTRLPCPSPSPGVCPSSYLLKQWCHPAISSSVVLFSSRPQSFPASGSLLTSRQFASGGHSIGAPASASVLPKSIESRMYSAILSVTCWFCGGQSQSPNGLSWGLSETKKSGWRSWMCQNHLETLEIYVSYPTPIHPGQLEMSSTQSPTSFSPKFLRDCWSEVSVWLFQFWETDGRGGKLSSACLILSTCPRSKLQR